MNERLPWMLRAIILTGNLERNYELKVFRIAVSHVGIIHLRFVPRM